MQKQVNKDLQYTKYGTLIIIVKYNKSSNIEIEFQDEYKFITNTTYANFKRGYIKNPYDKSVCGVGYIGVGKYKSKVGGDLTPAYFTWKNMVHRCYDEDHRYLNITYEECYMCNEWLNFQTFAKWYEDNFYDVGEGRMHIDKDILIKGNKLYSPETCIIVPQRINMIFMSKANKWNLPSGISMSKTGKYITSYNGIHLGTIDTLNDAIITHDTEKRKCIKEIVEEYGNKLPSTVSGALLSW